MTSSALSPTPWRRLPADLAAVMRPRLPANVEAVTTAITEATPAFTELEESRFDRYLRIPARSALERFLDLVGTDEPALTPTVREIFVGLGAAEAREDRGPEAVLLPVLRMASRLLLRTVSETLAGARHVGIEELIDLSDAVRAYVDELAAASSDGYALQLREQAGEGDRRRRQLAELLLRGSAPASVVLDAAAGIGWRTLDAMVPVVLPLDQARDARFRYGADGLVVERERDAILLLREGPRASRTQLTEALDGRAAVVGPALGWTQLPEAVRLAELAAELCAEPIGTGTATQQLGPRTAPRSAPVFTDDHLATLALRGETGALAVLSARRLAPLIGIRDAPRDRLLQTLHSWLRHWGSRIEVSAELYVHPQTVSYRLKQLRGLFGDELDDPDTRFELLLVLAARTQLQGD